MVTTFTAQRGTCVESDVDADPRVGELPSFADLARYHGDAIRRVALELTRSESAAQDVVQEVLVRVMSRGGFDSDRGSFERWLRIVTRNTAIDWIRREAAHRQRVLRVGALHTATNVDVQDAVAARVQAASVHTAVAQLPDGEREVVLLAYFGGLTYRQVAVRTGLAEGTVKSRIRRALTRMANTIGTDADV